MSAWYHVYIKNSTTYDFVYIKGSVNPAAVLFGDKAGWNRSPHDIKSQLGAPDNNVYAFDCWGSNGCTGYVKYAIIDPEEDNKKIATLTLQWLARSLSCSASATVDSEAVRVTRDDRKDEGIEEVIHHVEVKQGI